MSLPIDRTNKTALDANLVNGNTSDAPAIKNSNDVVYNTIDELYNYSQGLINASILTQASVTPVANKIAQRDANGNVLSAMPISNGQNPNLLFNPSFRMGSNGWRGIGTNGFTLQFGAGGEGGYLANATSIGASGTQVDINLNLITASANTSFTLSGEMFTVGVTAGSIGFQWFAFDTNKVAISGTSFNATNGTAWSKYSATFTTPANTAYIQVACYMGANTTNTNAGWRKIKVESGTVATTFSDDNTLNTSVYGSALGLAQVLSGGYKEQSGTGSIAIATAGNQVSANITFPVAFGSAPSNILLSYQGGLTGSSGYNLVFSDSSSWTTTGFMVVANAYIAGTMKFGWIALGT